MQLRALGDSKRKQESGRWHRGQESYVMTVTKLRFSPHDWLSGIVIGVLLEVQKEGCEMRRLRLPEGVSHFHGLFNA
jgi:hypothetical protein